MFFYFSLAYRSIPYILKLISPILDFVFDSNKRETSVKKKKKMPPVRQDSLDEKKTEHDRVVGQMGEGEGFDLQKPLTSGVSLSFSRGQHLLSPDEYFAYRTPSCNRVSKK